MSRSLLSCVLVVAALSLLMLCAVSAAIPEPGWSVRCRVVEVYDGDTVVVEWSHRARVRLLDCWAPEVRTSDIDEKQAGEEARDWLKDRAEGKAAVLWVPVDQVDMGKSTTLGRYLGRVYVDGKDISKQMVEAGYATATKE